MFKCYVQGPVAPQLVPARPHRDWMDRYPGRHPYRCLPLAIANTFGWELLSPCDLKIEWNGRPGFADIQISAEDDFPLVNEFAVSNFAAGIVSFHTGYLFVTDPDWLLLATGPLNQPRDGMVPLSGLIETEWLPYTFGMNWQLMRPGVHRFRKNEPFCHIVPVQVKPLLAMEPEILDLDSNPELAAQVASYRERRLALRARQSEQFEVDGTDAPSWTREYFHGRLADGFTASNHCPKLRLREPVDRRTIKVEEQAVRIDETNRTAKKGGVEVNPSAFTAFGYRPGPKPK